MKRTILAFLGFYALCLLVQAMGGIFTQAGVECWYPTLTKSALTPPGYMFGVAWTALYLLMAVAAARVSARVGWRSNAIACWAIQLILGLAWTVVFFAQKEIAVGFAVILANLIAVAATYIHFRRIDRLAGLLILPLLLWLTFASYLNGFILANN